MVAAGHFTVGSVLEEHAAMAEAKADIEYGDAKAGLNHEEAFEAGLSLIIDGLAQRSICV